MPLPKFGLSERLLSIPLAGSDPAYRAMEKNGGILGGTPTSVDLIYQIILAP